MTRKRTEALHEQAGELDRQQPATVLGYLADAQVEAAGAVRAAIPDIADAAAIVTETSGSGERLASAATSSSGLMALAGAAREVADAAAALLDGSGGRLRPALSTLAQSTLQT